jgi:hypothetical protein
VSSVDIRTLPNYLADAATYMGDESGCELTTINDIQSSWRSWEEAVGDAERVLESMCRLDGFTFGGQECKMAGHLTCKLTLG